MPEALWLQVAKVREAVLETIFTLAPRGASFIFTYAGADEDPSDHKTFEYRNAARRGMRFIAVRLVCREEELSRRLQSAGRVGPKLIDPVDAITNVRNYTVLDPRLPDTLTLDTTDLLPEAVATVVLAHINTVMGLERRGSVVQPRSQATGNRRSRQARQSRSRSPNGRACTSCSS